MARDAELRWLARDGKLRTPWRVLLFTLLFLVLLQLQALVVATFFRGPRPADDVLAALAVQGLLLLVAALVSGWVMLRWIDRAPLGDLGFALSRRAFPELGAGMLIGSAAITGAVTLLALTGTLRYQPADGSPAAWIAVMGGALAWLAIPAFAEEAVFRGYLFRTLVEGVGPVAATLLLSALFAAVHGANPNVAAFGVLNIFLAGVMLSLAVLRTGSLWLASALHLGWNWAMAAPFDLPVSGLDPFDAPLYTAVVRGPAWLTGGEFGPEGGLAGFTAVLVGTGLIWWRYGERRDDHGQYR